MRKEVSEGNKLHGEEFQNPCIVLDITRIISTALFLMQMWGEYCWRWIAFLVIIYTNFAKQRINGVDVIMLFSTMTQQLLVGHDLHIIQESRSHPETPHSVGFLWTSDQPRRTDLYLTTHNTHNTDVNDPGEIRAHNGSRRAAADPRLRPRGHWDRLIMTYARLISGITEENLL